MLLDDISALQQKIDQCIENQCERTRLVITHMITSDTLKVVVYIDKSLGVFVHKDDMPVISYYTCYTEISESYKKPIGNYTLFSEKHPYIGDFIDAVYSDPTSNLLMPNES